MNAELLTRVTPPSETLPTRSKEVTPWMSSAILLALAILMIASLGNYKFFRPLAVDSVADVMLLVGATFVALTIHEAGHLLASLCCGFRVSAVSLGIFRWSRAQEGWHFTLNAKRIFAGSVSAFPKSNQFWRGRMLMVISAGPLATLTGGVAAYLIFNSTRTQPEFVSHFAQALGQISFVILVLSLIPSSRTAASQNDAGLFCAVFQNGKAAQGIFLYHLVLQHQSQGLEPGEFPFWLIEEMASFQGRSDFMLLYANLIAIWARDGGDYQLGTQWSTRVIHLSSEHCSSRRGENPLDVAPASLGSYSPIGLVR